MIYSQFFNYAVEGKEETLSEGHVRHLDWTDKEALKAWMQEHTRWTGSSDYNEEFQFTMFQHFVYMSK